MARIPKIRVNTPVPFPTLVQGSGPITLSKSNGVWSAGISFTNVAQAYPPAPSLPSDLVLVWDNVAKVFVTVSLAYLAAIGGGGGGGAIGPPSPSQLGGVYSASGAPHYWISSINTDGSVTFRQPSYADIAGTPPSTPIGTPGPATLGGVFSNAGAIHKWISSINTDGSVTLGQPAFTDITGTLAPAQMPLFTSTLVGAVPASGGGTANFLRADGSWAAAGGSVGVPGPATLGGVFSNAGAASKWIKSINTDGSVTLAQPAFTDVSGTLAPAQIPLFTSTLAGAVQASGGGTTNFLRADGNWAGVGSASITPPAPAVLGGVFSNVGAAHKWVSAIITDGSVTLTQPNYTDLAGTLPTPAAAVLGGIFSNAGSASKWVSAILTSGAVTLTQPAFSDLTGSFTAAQTPAFTGDVTKPAGSTVTTIAAGAVTLADMANLAANSVIGNNTGSAAAPIALTKAQLTAMINAFTTALPGAVPASGGGTTNFLRADGAWAAAGGSVGPPAVAVLGGVFSNVGAANKWISAINTDGSVTLTQPAAANISGLGTFAAQNYATPPAIGGTTPAAGSFAALSASGLVAFPNATDSTAQTNGALVVGGGVGVAKSISAGGQINLNGPPASYFAINTQGQSLSGNGTAIPNSIVICPACIAAIIMITECQFIGDVAFYICSAWGSALVGGAGPGVFVGSTSAPAAGKISVATDGSFFRVWNNLNSACAFRVQVFALA